MTPPETLDPIYFKDQVLVFKVPHGVRSRTRAVVPADETTLVRMVMVGEDAHAFYKLANFCCLLVAIFNAHGERIG